jgi:hypothetical protein
MIDHGPALKDSGRMTLSISHLPLRRIDYLIISPLGHHRFASTTSIFRVADIF